MRIDARRKNIIFAVGIRHTKNHNTLFMAEYIFYTTDGFTQAPDGNDIEHPLEEYTNWLKSIE